MRLMFSVFLKVTFLSCLYIKSGITGTDSLAVRLFINSSPLFTSAEVSYSLSFFLYSRSVLINPGYLEED